ncbi:hypothetical protein L2E82_26125 [Cichorium intybus]|uniref:Uncharacterized protein n=1 Tax=Cichorium intybus TaxID=13427 RepID=A0ACB9E5Y2_CICIN|nr:hypothetical protein L2E82_26125 [Cichorium intybus]
MVTANVMYKKIFILFIKTGFREASAAHFISLGVDQSKGSLRAHLSSPPLPLFSCSFLYASIEKCLIESLSDFC